MELQTKENSIQELKNENVEKEERILQSRGGYGGLVWKFQTPSKDCRLWHVVYP